MSERTYTYEQFEQDGIFTLIVAFYRKKRNLVSVDKIPFLFWVIMLLLSLLRFLL